MSDRDYVAEATADGWAPKEEWRGDDDKWIDAQEFVEKGEKSAGILRSKVDRLSGQVESLLNTNKEFKEFTDAQLAKSKAENARLLDELKAQRKTAVTEGDGEAFEAADAKITQMEAQKDPEPISKSDYDKMANDWLQKNSWYNTDEDLHIYADGLAEKVHNDGFLGQAYFDELTRRMKERHPDKFGRKKPQAVESGGEIEKVDSKARNYENLPQEAKDACDRFVNDIPGFKKEDFVSTYDWE